MKKWRVIKDKKEISFVKDGDSILNKPSTITFDRDLWECMKKEILKVKK